MSKTKGELVLLALRKAGIASSSSLIDPTAAMLDDYLGDLENMMATWDGVEGIRIGYMFSDPEYGVSTGDDSGIPDWAIQAVSMNLAVNVLTDRSKPIKPSIAAGAKDLLASLHLRTTEVAELVRRRDMPRGAGNKPWFYNSRFYSQQRPDLETSDGEDIL